MSNISPLYDAIGRDYDATRKCDSYIASRLAGLLHLDPSHACLDIACGTGNYTISLAAQGGRWHGVELSGTMVEQARAKSDHIEWIVGDAARLPFEDGSFDRLLCTLAIHHFPDLPAVFRETYRVMRSGRFVLFTTYPEQTAAYWLREHFPVALERSVAQLSSRDDVIGGLVGAGFTIELEEPYDVRPDLQDLFLYAGKHRPALYLDPNVRAGISTFAALATSDEVETGCARLEEDIRTGRIEKVIAEHENDGGDYMFVVAEYQG